MPKSKASVGASNGGRRRVCDDIATERPAQAPVVIKGGVGGVLLRGGDGEFTAAGDDATADGTPGDRLT